MDQSVWVSLLHEPSGIGRHPILSLMQSGISQRVWLNIVCHSMKHVCVCHYESLYGVVVVVVSISEQSDLVLPYTSQLVSAPPHSSRHSG